MYKSVIEEINKLQEKRISSICQNGSLSIAAGCPPTNQCGLYWIYTNHTNNDFLNSKKSQKNGSVNFKERVESHQNLNHVCNKKIDDFRIVYNGIGGAGKNQKGGLRERILAEFNGGQGTGSLAIKSSSLNNLNNWRISYVLWSEIKFDVDHGYGKHSKLIERLWRIHYGWPILCAK